MVCELRNSDPFVTVSHYAVASQIVYIWSERQSIGIPVSDFLKAAMYVLTNLPLSDQDPRLEFVEKVSKLKVVGDKLYV